MIASVLIIVLSMALLVYWFRYSCLLLLREQAELALAVPAAELSRFSFGDVRQRLASEQNLDSLQSALNRDYRILVYLLEHAAGLGPDSVEDRLLVWDYKIMTWCYRLTRTMAPLQARQALSEMASVIGILAAKMSERAGVQAEA